MTPRETVLAQIEHRETPQVPYTLPFEEEVAARLDEHYGGNEWRQRMVPYVARCGGVINPLREPVDDAHAKDVFGTVWRTDRLPSVVVEPGVKKRLPMCERPSGRPRGLTRTF